MKSGGCLQCIIRDLYYLVFKLNRWRLYSADGRALLPACLARCVSWRPRCATVRWHWKLNGQRAVLWLTNVEWSCYYYWIAATTISLCYEFTMFLPSLFSSPCLLCLVDLPEVTGTHRKFRSIVSSLIGMVERLLRPTSKTTSAPLNSNLVLRSAFTKYY